MAMGRLRATAYIANINEASVGVAPAGSIDFGLTSAAIENPPATKTLIAVTSAAIRLGADGEESGVIAKVSVAIGITPLDVIGGPERIIVYYYSVRCHFFVLRQPSGGLICV